MKYVVGALAVASALVAGPALAAGFYDFSTPVVTGSTPAPGVWSTDRYAPAGFQTVFQDGNWELQQTISAADAAANRPAGYTASFYNTQGRKFELEDGAQAMSIDLYVSGDWQGTGNRMAGFWGEGVDGDGAIVAYPIIEFVGTRDGGTFRGWDFQISGSFADLGLPEGFFYDNWYTLNVSLTGGQFHYSVGLQGQALTEFGAVDALGAKSISNVILQGHNTQTGVDSLIRWDNLAAVPEPSAWALMILGFGSAGAMLRRRRAVASVA